MDQKFYGKPPNIEIVIVDDGSTQLNRNYRDVINVYGNGSFKYYIDISVHELKYNYGISIARNMGVEKSKYDIIGYLDADDLYYPDRISSSLGLLVEHDVDWIVSPVHVVKKEQIITHEPDFEKSFFAPVLGVLHKKHIFGEGFPINSYDREDNVLWETFYKNKFKLHYNKILAGKYFISANRQHSTHRIPTHFMKELDDKF